MEESGQLELVVDFIDSGRRISGTDMVGLHPVVEISISGFEYGHLLDDICDVEEQNRKKNVIMEHIETHKEPTKADIFRQQRLVRASSNSMDDIEIINSIHATSDDDDGNTAPQIAIEKQSAPSQNSDNAAHNLVPWASLTGTSRNLITGIQKRKCISKERGWNQYCTGANVPISSKRTHYSLLGRFKSNPVLENCYLSPNIKSMNYKIQ